MYLLRIELFASLSDVYAPTVQIESPWYKYLYFTKASNYVAHKSVRQVPLCNLFCLSSPKNR